MRKKFKTKKKKNRLYILFFVVSSICFVFSMFFNILKNIELTSTNEEFIKRLMYDSNHYLKYEKNNYWFQNIINKILNVNLSNPLSLINKNLEYEEKIEEENIFMVNINESYLKEPNKNESNDTRVYIYSSHQSEEYNNENYSKYGINSGVMMASYLLKERLNSLGINTIIEEGDFVEFMRVNNYTHAYSYIASRYFIEPVIRENDFDLIIDLHRDSNKRESSTVTIDGKNYAKVLFVVGLENDNYKTNLKKAEEINALIVKKYPTLTRGIYKKEGPGVDGVYNQDLNGNMILLEVGGYQNTIGEVNNTIEIMSEIIKEYLESI